MEEGKVDEGVVLVGLESGSFRGIGRRLDGYPEEEFPVLSGRDLF